MQTERVLGTLRKLQKKPVQNFVSRSSYFAVDYSIYIYVEGTLCNFKATNFKKKRKKLYSEFNLFFKYQRWK